jgi:hypothetical protein
MAKRKKVPLSKGATPEDQPAPPAARFVSLFEAPQVVERVNPKTDLPYRWDYWMYDEYGEYIYKYDYNMLDHPDMEFLERTACDADFWATKFFWTTDQATALSFGRSPEKTEFDTYMEEMDGSSEFATYFCENSRDAAEIHFVKHIKTEILKVQVVICSPSLGTGIDMTFPDGECRVDRVFGFFYSFVNTHTDIDQQLSRVRNPGAIDVWINEGGFNFTSNVDVVMDDLARAYTVKRAVKGRRDDGMVEYDREDPLLLICAHVTAAHRASKNRLLELFCELREANGWAIERVNPRTGTAAYDNARKMLAAERAEMLLAAETLPDPEFMELDTMVTKGAAVTLQERITHEKNHFERTVGASLDSELIELNKDGRLIERVVALAEVTAHWRHDYSSEIIDHSLREAARPLARLQQMKPPRMIAVLMRVAGLTDPDGFKPDQVVTIGELSGFVDLCGENRTMIEEALSEPLRDDLAANPVRQLNRFLGRVGLRVASVGSVKVQGVKIRRYTLDRKRLETMMSLAKSYRIEEDRREYEKEVAKDGIMAA